MANVFWGRLCLETCALSYKIPVLTLIGVWSWLTFLLSNNIREKIYVKKIGIFILSINELDSLVEEQIHYILIIFFCTNSLSHSHGTNGGMIVKFPLLWQVYINIFSLFNSATHIFCFSYLNYQQPVYNIHRICLIKYF